MTIAAHEQEWIQSFFDEIPACLVDGRNDATVSYFAIRKQTNFVVVAGRLTLGASTDEITWPDQFETESVRAGHFLLSRVGQTPREFVNATTGPGLFATPEKELMFLGNDPNTHGAYRQPLKMEALKESTRVAVLTLSGRQKFDLLNGWAQFDWELKAAQTPFDGLADLANEYRLGSLQGSNISIDVEVPNAVEVHPTSYIHDKVARIVIAPQFFLDATQVSLRVLVTSRGNVIRREAIETERIKWLDADCKAGVCGVFELEVPVGATVQCIAVYGKLAQHERTIVDKSGENELRLVLDSFPAGTAAIRQALRIDEPFENNSDALETSLASVVSMLGFQVLHFGTGKKTRDFVDVVARCNSGGLLLIECTTAILLQDKVSNLKARAAKLRRFLVDKDFPDIQVIPVIATTMTAAELSNSIGQVETGGALVLCKEQLEEWFDLSRVAPDANRLLTSMSQRLADAQNRPDGALNFASIPADWARLRPDHGGAIEL